MPEWTQIFLQLGFPTASLILVVWKGVPWIQSIYAEHKAEMKSIHAENKSEMKSLMDAHLAKIEEKDKDLKEIHDSSMRIIEANTRAINALVLDVGSIKEANNQVTEINTQLKELIIKTNSLTDWVKADMSKNAS